MPVFWMPATFWQVMLHVVIRTLEKHREWGNLGGHMCCGQGWHDQRVMHPKELQQTVRTCLSVWGRGLRYRNTSAQEESQHLCRKFCFLISHPGRLSGQPLRGRPSAKHKRNAFYPRSPSPLTRAPSLLWFLFLQLVVSKPFPGIVEVLPE